MDNDKVIYVFIHRISCPPYNTWSLSCPPSGTCWQSGLSRLCRGLPPTLPSSPAFSSRRSGKTSSFVGLQQQSRFLLSCGRIGQKTKMHCWSTSTHPIETSLGPCSSASPTTLAGRSPDLLQSALVHP